MKPDARQIVCEEWQRAVKEFKLRPGTITEKVVARIVTRIDEALGDTEAYQRYTDNHPTIHSNRFPAWSELTEDEKQKWRDTPCRS